MNNVIPFGAPYYLDTEFVRGMEPEALRRLAADMELDSTGTHEALVQRVTSQRVFVAVPEKKWTQAPHLEPTDLLSKLGLLAEECGEVVQEVGKILRFGIDNHHPDEPDVSNAERLLREINDLKLAIHMVEEELA